MKDQSKQAINQTQNVDKQKYSGIKKELLSNSLENIYFENYFSEKTFQILQYKSNVKPYCKPLKTGFYTVVYKVLEHNI